MIQCIHIGCAEYFTGTGQEASSAGWYCRNYADSWFCPEHQPKGMTEQERSVDIAIEAELEDRAFGEGRHAP